MKTTRFFLPVVVAATLVTGACSSGEPTDTSSEASASGAAEQGEAGPATGPHNDADVEFVQAMVPHHEQALELSDLAFDRAENEQVLDLAQQIREAQDPQVVTMMAWLEGWDIELPETMDDTAHGMVSGADMDTLYGTAGAEFDQLWVDAVLAHHEGAVELAETEVENGENTQVTEMAQQIVDGQTTRIATLEELQGQL